MTDAYLDHCEMVNDFCSCRKSGVARCAAILKIPEEKLLAKANKIPKHDFSDLEARMGVYRVDRGISECMYQFMSAIREYAPTKEEKYRHLYGSPLTEVWYDEFPTMPKLEMPKWDTESNPMKEKRTGSIAVRKPHHKFLEDPVKKKPTRFWPDGFT